MPDTMSHARDKVCNFDITGQWMLSYAFLITRLLVNTLKIYQIFTIAINVAPKFS
jgi:hypothetical protein